MAKLTNAEIIASIEEMSVLELNELVKACEEEFGVSAAAGVVVAAAGAGEAEEQWRRAERRTTGAQNTHRKGITPAPTAVQRKSGASPDFLEAGDF